MVIPVETCLFSYSRETTESKVKKVIKVGDNPTQPNTVTNRSCRQALEKPWSRHLLSKRYLTTPNLPYQNLTLTR